MNWIERLKFYTKDLTKEKAIQLTRYITWVKVEGIIEEGKEIENVIEKHFTEPPIEHTEKAILPDEDYDPIPDNPIKQK